MLIPSLVVLVSLVSASVAQSLSSSLSGIDTVYPTDSGYADASAPFNSRFAYQPVAIAYAKSVDDISTIVKAGVAAGVNVVARSGGHR